MVSLLALTLRVPLGSVEVRCDGAAVVTVSVSTVIFFKAGSANDFGSTLATEVVLLACDLVGDISFLDVSSSEVGAK